MVRKVNHRELEQLLPVYYDKKKALIIYGHFGIGKSDAIRNVAKKIATQKSRIYIDWNKATQEEKDDAYIHPKKYFTLLDMRMSEFGTDSQLETKPVTVVKLGNKYR